MTHRNIRFYIDTMLYLIFSWIGIHALAIFGLFLALSYPFWRIITKKKTVCFFCRMRHEGDWCPLCRRTIGKDNLYPQITRSTILNMLLIAAVSILSIVFVFLESKTLSALGLISSQATVSVSIPPQSHYLLGEIFPMHIQIQAGKASINAVQADIKYDPKKVEVVDISTEGSFATIFVQKQIDNAKGFARLTGGLPNPGFSSAGLFGTVYFRSKNAGLVTIEFLPSSMVLANDGLGSAIATRFLPISYIIEPKSISKDEAQKQQSMVYSLSNVLGGSSSGTQMTFYEQRMLNIPPVPENENPRENISGQSFFSLIWSMDNAVLDLSRKVINSFVYR